MKKRDRLQEMQEKLDKGLKLSYARMIERKRKNKQQIVIIKDGKIQRVNP